MNKNLSYQDLELLSTYLDEQLSPAERKRLEARLISDPALQNELESLRRTRLVLRQTSLKRAPRNFTLTPDMVSQHSALSTGVRQRSRAVPALSFVSALASFILMLVVAGELIGTTGGLSKPMRAVDLNQVEVAKQPVVEAPAEAQMEAMVESTVEVSMDTSLETVPQQKLMEEAMPTEALSMNIEAPPPSAGTAPGEAVLPTPTGEFYLEPTIQVEYKATSTEMSIMGESTRQQSQEVPPEQEASPVPPAEAVLPAADVAATDLAMKPVETATPTPTGTLTPSPTLTQVPPLLPAMQDLGTPTSSVTPTETPQATQPVIEQEQVIPRTETSPPDTLPISLLRIAEIFLAIIALGTGIIAIYLFRKTKR